MIELDTFRVRLGRLPVPVPVRQFSIRRIEFDTWLLKRCGAPVLRHGVRRIVRDGEWYVLDDQFRCRYLIGAGGTNCPVKRSLFGEDRGALILTQEIEFETPPTSPACDLLYPFGGFLGYAWCVPKKGAVNVGFGGFGGQFRHPLKSYWAGFVRGLRDAGLLAVEPPSPAGYSYYLGDRRKPVRNGNAFIVGDAAGLATVDLGEGIGPAVESGLSAAREILGAGTYRADEVTKHSLPALLRSSARRLFA
jgi:flavin-dependent dehydrogenase